MFLPNCFHYVVPEEKRQVNLKLQFEVESFDSLKTPTSPQLVYLESLPFPNQAPALKELP